jgi:hypothetical protein
MEWSFFLRFLSNLTRTFQVRRLSHSAVLQRYRFEFDFELTGIGSITERLLRSAGYGQDLRDLERIMKIAGAVHLCG